MSVTGRLAAGIVVLVLLSAAVLAVRGAMQQRRARAERAWHDALSCVERSDASAARTRCTGMVQGAVASSFELPEHGARELELQAALGELASALGNASPEPLAFALARTARAGRALGWRAGPTELR